MTRVTEITEITRMTGMIMTRVTRVRNCTFLVANATKNLVLATRIS